MKPLISIVVPIYNAGRSDLTRMLDSIYNQTYKNIQVVLIDDGSTDESGEVCDEYAEKDSRAKVIHKKNGGVSDSLNTGINAVDGEYMLLTNQDDYLELQCIEKMYNAIEKTDAELCMCGMRNTRYDDTHQTDGAIFKIKSPEYVVTKKKPYEFYKYFSLAEESDYFLNKLMKSSVLKENKVYYPKNGVIHSDKVFMQAVIKYVEKAVIVPEALYVYCDSNTSTSNKDILRSYSKNCIAAVDYLDTVMDGNDKNYCKALNLCKFFVTTEIIFANKWFKDGLDVSKEKKLCFRWFLPYMFSPRVDFKYKGISFCRLFAPGLYVKFRKSYHRKKK